MKPAGRHDEIVELLPWFVNGTLPDDEHARVERHVHACLTCYAALQHERRLRSLVRDGTTTQLEAEHGFERLLARIERDAARPAHALGAGRRLRYAAAVVAVAVIGAALWLGLDGPTPPDSYETLTSGPGAPGPTLDLVFSDALPEAGMRALLREIDATIVAGPTDIGRYTVRLEQTRTDEELGRLIARLMRDERVRFAGRSFIGEGP